MLSPFFVNDKPLHLERFPQSQVNRSLQAWDSADELILDHLNEQALLGDCKNIVVFNDAFGALITNLANHEVTAFSDSWVSQQGIKFNLALNDLPTNNIDIFHCQQNLNTSPDIVILKLPKSLSLLEMQLRLIQPHLTANTVFIAAARIKDIAKSAFKLLEDIIGEVSTSLAVKKSRLIFCQPREAQLTAKDLTTQWHLTPLGLTISNAANVFARESLDIGARLFLDHLPLLKAKQQVLDLGCGNGVLGLACLHSNADIQCTFTDESFLAVSSANDNVAQNFDQQVLSQCQFVVGDCLSELSGQKFDHILCNPPFHQQHAVTDHIAWQMFNESFRALKKGGELRIVGNRQLGYHIKLKRIFGNCKTIASNKKFVILSAIKK